MGAGWKSRKLTLIIRDVVAEPVITTPDPRRTSNLPAQLTSVIEHDREIEAGCDLLRQPSTRVLTLTGPPGIGKTRLSIQIAAAMQNLFTDGAWFVPLAAISDPALIPSGIAHVLVYASCPAMQWSTRCRSTCETNRHCSCWTTLSIRTDQRQPRCGAVHRTRAGRQTRL
jgi:hypothetical protein